MFGRAAIHHVPASLKLAADPGIGARALEVAKTLRYYVETLRARQSPLAGEADVTLASRVKVESARLPR